MGPINPWTLLHRYQNKHFTCWPARRLTSRSDWTCHKLSIKLGSYTQNGHSLELGGRHFKNNKTKKKRKKKKIHLPLIYIIQSAILKSNPCIFKMKKKITKLVNTKVVRSQLVYIQKIYKFIFFRLLPQTAHLSLQSTTCLDQLSLQETTGQGFTKSIKTAPNCNHLFSLNYATTIPLGIFILKPLKPTNFLTSAMSPQNETFHSISLGWQQIILKTFRWEMQQHWMQKTVLTTFIGDALPISPCKRSWHLTQDPKKEAHIFVSYRLCSKYYLVPTSV